MGRILKSKFATWVEVIVSLVVIGIGTFFVINYLEKEAKESKVVDISKEDKVIRVGVNTWGGFAGGQYWNAGFKANKESRYYKDHGLFVEFILIDDFTASREALKSGKIDLLWCTTDLFPTDAPNLPDDVKIVFQADWSRGGDAVVAMPTISSVSDLKGKKVAVSLLTPSHTLLISLLEQSGLKLSDVKIVETANAMDAAAMFKSGQVDAAIVWSPDDMDCLDAVKGSKILTSTKTATHIISDVMIAKNQFIEDNLENLTILYDGWMQGNAILNSDDKAKREASKILAQNFEGVDEDFCYLAINNARLVTHGDNLNFYGLNKSYKGITGEDIWNKMSVSYANLGYVDRQLNWREANSSKVVSNSKLNVTDKGQMAESFKEFTAPTKSMENKSEVKAISSKSASINFASGSSTLDEVAKFTIDKEFVDIAKINTTARIRIIGNTDNTGSLATNTKLSHARAEAVANYLETEYGISKNRMVVVGNGPKDAIADGVSGSSDKYRRTDFELIVE